MNKTFIEAVEEIKEIEGGYSDHPADPGQKTKFGITEDLARHYDYQGKMKNLSWQKAREIYHKEYWLKNDYGAIKNQRIAKEVFEQAINLPYIVINDRGVLKANYHLQMAYVYTAGDEITIDGLIGPQTLNAVNNCTEPVMLHNILNGFQAKHYLEVREKYPHLQAFIRGWFKQRIKIIKK